MIPHRVDRIVGDTAAEVMSQTHRDILCFTVTPLPHSAPPPPVWIYFIYIYQTYGQTRVIKTSFIVFKLYPGHLLPATT